MHYSINEGSIALPDHLIDRTVNMLMTPDGKGISYTISRDKLQAGENLTELIDRQLKDLSRQVSKFVEIERQAIPFKNSPQTAYQITNSFKQNGREFYQRQIVVALKNADSILVVTGTSFAPWSDAEIAAWTTMLKNSQLH